MTAISKAELLKARSEGDRGEVELPGGGSVVVRGLTRKEALAMKADEADPAGVERKMIALALVEPALTEDEVGQWQEVAGAGDLEPVVDAILELSGMHPDAPKQAVKRFRR